MSGTQTDKLGGRGLSSEPVYVSDLGRCEPAEAISHTSERRRWRAYDYEVGGFGGVMLMAGPETEAPDITYPLEAEGWHAVSIGFYSTIQGLSGVSDFLVRLSGDDTFSVLDPVRADAFEQQGQLEEIYWKTADLTGQQIVFGQLTRRRAQGEGPGVVECGPVRIAYVKLVPLTASEAEDQERDMRDGENKRLYAHNDSFSFQNEYRPITPEAIRRQIEPYRDTDFSRIYWEVGSGDTLYYPSKVGRNWDTIDLPRDYGRMNDRLRDEAWRILREDGVDPFRVAVDHAHEIGLEAHGSYRLAGWTYPPPTLSYAFEGGMWERRPDLRCLDRDGRYLPRLSYAFREVQDFALSVLREMASYPVDGLALLYNRRPPYIMYEQPLIDGFLKEHGEDPHELPEFDPTWLAYRAGVVTEFMRRVRAELDAVAEEQGRGPIQITACVLGEGGRQHVLRPGHGDLGEGGADRHAHPLQPGAAGDADSERHMVGAGAGGAVRVDGEGDRLRAVAERHAEGSRAGRKPPNGLDAVRRRGGVAVLLGYERALHVPATMGGIEEVGAPGGDRGVDAGGGA